MIEVAVEGIKTVAIGVLGIWGLLLFFLILTTSATLVLESFDKSAKRKDNDA